MFVELIFFRTKPEATDAEVLEKAHKIQNLAAQLNASFQLEVLRTDDGEWVEIAHWSSREEAERVEQAIMMMPEALEAMSVMDESSIRMVFLNPVQQTVNFLGAEQERA